MKMGNKYAALLLLVWVVVGECVESNTMENSISECYSSCHSECHYESTAFCKWWCGDHCSNPKEIKSNDDGSKKYPVPTEEDYKSYIATNPATHENYQGYTSAAFPQSSF